MQNRLYIFPKATILLNLSASKDQILEFAGSKIDHIDNFKYLKTKRLFKDFEGIIGEDDFKIRRLPNFGY